MTLAKRALRLGLAVLTGIAVSFGAPSATAQTVGNFGVGSISTKQDCRYFQESDGSAAQIATPWLYASSVQWRTWWVKDCVAQFPTMRASLEAAMASARGMPPAPTEYFVNVTIDGVSGGDPVRAPRPGGPNGYSFARNAIFTTYSLTVTDRTGRVIFGQIGTKSIETGQEIIADGARSRTTITGEAVYGVLQNELAMTIARTVLFHFNPLRVVNVQSDRILLNYGAPVLTLGARIRVPSARGLRTIPYAIISSDRTGAIAETDGDFDDPDVAPGAVATYLEQDDPAANGRRYDRTKLP